MQKNSQKPPYLVRPSTAVITRGFDPWLSVGSARPAVFRSSTYVFQSPEEAERAFDIALGRAEAKPKESVGLIYSRLSHPNAEIFEDQIVPLEPKAESAAVFNSGMAAIATTLMTFCQPKGAFIYTVPVYGGTHHLIHQILIPYGFRAIPVPAGDSAAMADAIRSTDQLRLVLIETPANPTLVMSDIRAAVEAAAAHTDRPLVAVDNTFLGPTFQHPLALGADLSIYSGTKFISGFSDMLAGVVLGRDRKLLDQLRGTRAIFGNILQPDECWMLDSRLPTVTLRMNRQSKNAQRIAEALSENTKVRETLYPTLFRDIEQRRIRDAQCTYPGSIISLKLAGGKKSAFDFLRHLTIARNAVSLGGIESLACHPASTTHSEMAANEREKSGITDDLVRLSIGVEDWRDLLKDFRQALDRA